MSEEADFCILLWAYQGGTVNARGQPVFGPRVRASGYCNVPDECSRCPLMQNEIDQHPPGHANWVCPACLREIAQVAAQKGILYRLVGHYTEGQCQFVGCTRPPRIEYSEGTDRNTPFEQEMKIVIPPRYSRFLQLVIGDINR